MGLPDPRLYYLAFEMSKLAKYWEETGDTVDWMDIEKTLCSPFNPTERLSQQVNTTNPILAHSGEVWTRVHRANKLSHYVQKYASLWNNPAICIGKTLVCWNKWYSCGIHTIGDLYSDGVFMSYTDLTRKFTLEGKQHF